MNRSTGNAAYPDTTINIDCRPRVARMETQGDIDYINVKLGVWRVPPPEDRAVPDHAPEPFQYLFNPETVEEFQQRVREHWWDVMLWERELTAREEKKRKRDAKKSQAANLAKRLRAMAGKGNPVSNPLYAPANTNFKPLAQINSQPILTHRSVFDLSESTKPLSNPTLKVSRNQHYKMTGLSPVEEDASKGTGIRGKRSLPKDQPGPPGTSKKFKKNPNSGRVFTTNRPMPYVKVEEGPRSGAKGIQSASRGGMERSQRHRVFTFSSDRSGSPSSADSSDPACSEAVKRLLGRLVNRP